MKRLNRRSFLKKSLAFCAGASFSPLLNSCVSKRVSSSKKILILGIDGMDPVLSAKFMAQGIMPNFSILTKRGSFSVMKTSIPPQSPVAWSNFAIGSSPSIHGIFDFIHRDPDTMLPYLSTSKVTQAEKTIDIRDWRIPLMGGKTDLLRTGKPFWEYLCENGITATIFKIPANFPAQSKKARLVSGMGTPDILGGYGTFTLFTTDTSKDFSNMTGGRVVPVHFKDEIMQAGLSGPLNTFKKEKTYSKIFLEVFRDKINKVIKLHIQGQKFILQEGEWTGWVPLSFDMVPHIYNVKAICKFLVKRIYPEFVMYVSPLNIDPTDQVLPITSTPGYGRELVDKVGFFYTQGMPEDTKALSNNVLTEDEYLQLAYQIIHERENLLDYELKRFISQKAGLLFFYFSSLDQDTHMYWRAMDSDHPLYFDELGRKYGDVIKNLYIEMDTMLGKVMQQFDLHDPDNLLFVMSDHGFAPFNKQVNLNTWLYKNGYIKFKDPNKVEDKEYFSNVDWSKTSAYALGINSLYINTQGRDRFGIVMQAEADRLMRDIRRRLLSFLDRDSGQNAVSNVWLTKDIYKRQDNVTPDLIVGWNKGYRASWDSILGGFSKDIIRDNDDKWSGDHCIDPIHVPAVLFANRSINKPDPAIFDLTATILEQYNIPLPVNMQGVPLILKNKA